MGTFSSPLNTAPSGALTEATLGWTDSKPDSQPLDGLGGFSKEHSLNDGVVRQTE